MLSVMTLVFQDQEIIDTRGETTMTTSATPIDLPTRTKPQPNKRIRKSKAQWKALLEDYATSGLIQAAFCLKHHIATSSLGFYDITESLAKAPSPLPDIGRDGHWQVN
ncbi:MAG: hypothetical protein P8Z77_00240 [Candidatus Thiodiazotropha sp.]